MQEDIARLTQQYDEERAERLALAGRLEALRAILTDPVNQLEQTKAGYYIYRFDHETMHEIADAIGLVRVAEQTLAFLAPAPAPSCTRCGQPCDNLQGTYIVAGANGNICHRCISAGDAVIAVARGSAVRAGGV